VQLDEITAWIDRAFGAEQAVQNQPASPPDEDALRELLGREGFQRYMRDQANRQIIRDYLTNAVVLGVIPEGGLAAFAQPLRSEDGRATLALYMLMSAVEDAAELPPACNDSEIRPLEPEAGDRSHIKLVPR
jgi:hypothetical protein